MQQTSRILGGVLLAALALPTSALAQESSDPEPFDINEVPNETDPEMTPESGVDDAFRISAGLQLGFAGSFGSVQDVDLAPSFGAQVQGHYPIGRFLLVGGSLAFRSLKVDIDGADRTNLMAIGPSFGGHYAIDLGSITIDPFVLATIGLAVAFSNDTQPDAEIGIDFGIRAGANVWFSDRFGAYASIGYQREDVFTDPETTSIWQIHTDLGVSFRL